MNPLRILPAALLLLACCIAPAADLQPVLSTTTNRTLAPTLFGLQVLTNANATELLTLIGATPSSNAVTLTGSQTVAGAKSFTNSSGVWSGTAPLYLPLAGGTMSGFLNAANGLRYGDALYTEISGNFGLRIWNAGSIGFSSGADASATTMDVLLRRDAAAVLALRDSTAAQTLRVYGTYTDSSNHVRAGLAANTTSVTLAAETAGTGADNIDLNLIPAGTGGVVIGSGGAGIKVVLSATATLDFDLTAVDVEDLTLTVTGAEVGNVVALGVPHGSVTATAAFTAWVSASDTVTVRCRVAPAAAEDPASGTFRATVIKH